MRTLADFDVHVPINSSCVVADAVLLSNTAVLRSNVLSPTIANVCPSSSVQDCRSSYIRSSWPIKQKIDNNADIGGQSKAKSI